MEYNLVSADSHMDMSWLPGDLFEKNSPSHLKEVMPKVVDTENGPPMPKHMAQGNLGGGNIKIHQK